MDSSTPKDVVAGLSQIGALPQTLAAVLKVLNDPNSGAKEIGRVISSDVSLTTLALKMVNSAHYGRHRRVARISEAVSLMGINSLKVLALSSSVFSLMTKGELAERSNIKRICRHLIEVGVTARRISEATGSGEPEEAFVAGILHDVGIVIMILHFREKYFDMIANLNARKQGLLTSEKETFGFTHCEVGAELIEAWKMPPKLAFVARHHHNTDEARIIPDESVLNDIIALADRITLGPFDETRTDIEANIEFIHTVSGKLNLTYEALNLIRKESIVQSIKLSQYLEIDVGDLIDILTDANNKLAELYISLEKLYLEKQELLKRLEANIPEAVEVPV